MWYGNREITRPYVRTIGIKLFVASLAFACKSSYEPHPNGYTKVSHLHAELSFLALKHILVPVKSLRGG
ncbi:hypothetical protein DPMN_132187 [Dreissena polymorpha]|uniref:Uncharacterized protein n=1 Tax=Dreissena polymorpha TaxID=45954 RepID=A0A9D4J9V5_DREPO|nr:hypothetical protein DPMN_132187 [Dreissena polymorpha]